MGFSKEAGAEADMAQIEPPDKRFAEAKPRGLNWNVAATHIIYDKRKVDRKVPRYKGVTNLLAIYVFWHQQ